MSDIRNFFAKKDGGTPPSNVKAAKKKETDDLDKAIRKSNKKAEGVVVLSDESDNEAGPVVKSKSTSPARKSAPKPEPEPPKKMEPVAASDFFGSKKVQQAPPPPRKERDPNAPPPAPAPTKKDKKRKSNSPEKPAPGAVDEFDEFGDDFDVPDDFLDPAKYSQTPEDAAPASGEPSGKRSKSGSPAKAAAASSKPATQPPTPAPNVVSPSPSKEKKKSPAKRPIEEDKDEGVIDLDTGDEESAQPATKRAKTEPSPQKKAATPVVASPSAVLPTQSTSSQANSQSQSQASASAPEQSISSIVRERAKKGLDVRGAENCMAGMTVVFSGEFDNFSREEAEDIVKRHGGKVTGSVSGKTTYLVRGKEAGNSKSAKAEEVGTEVLTEEEFINKVRTLKPQKIVLPSPKGKGKGKGPALPVANKGDTSSMLWTDKYAPKRLEDLVGNPGLAKQLQTWLQNWSPSGDKKAALLSGPPGIGKTTMAHLVAKNEGFNPVEFNASDARSKKILQSVVSGLTANHSMSEYLVGVSAEQKKKDAMNLPHKTVIIMDEVDGMSGGDRGGSQELIMMIRKTQVPIICICNDRQSTKVRTLSKYCLDLKFRRPDSGSVMKRLLPIAQAEGLNIQANTIQEICNMSQSDIRQVLNLLSMYRLSKNSMSYDQGKDLARHADKQPTWSIWDLVPKLFLAQNYEHATLSDKMDLYFYDYQFLPLMVQENYVRCTNPVLARAAPGQFVTKPMMDVRLMELLSSAADSISDGDLIDNVMRQTNNWSVMPLHSIASCVRPAYFMHGLINQPTFPATLGNMSKAGKNYRLLKELQLHMRLHISGDKTDVRQSYLPSLLPRLTEPLIQKATDGVPEVIDTMDTYWLTKDDWQSMSDLSLGKDMIAQIATNTKSAFTREYNKASHPMPFITQSVSKVKSGGPKPDMDDVIDLEENLEEEDDEDPSASPGSDDEGNGSGSGGEDLSKDKLISVKGAKGSGSKAGAKGGKGGAAPKASGSGGRGGGKGSRGGRGGKK